MLYIDLDFHFQEAFYVFQKVSMVLCETGYMITSHQWPSFATEAELAIRSEPQRNAVCMVVYV